MAEPDARTRLLDAAINAVRAQGYAGTSVDALCRAAGVTKGAFFHHFRTKDDLAVAAAKHWSDNAAALFAGAPYHDHADPLDRVLGYIDFRAALLDGAVRDVCCYAGTLVQEAYDTAPAIRAACADSIFSHATTLEADIAAARAHYAITDDWTAASLAIHTQCVLQGAFVLAKATGDVAVARDSVRNLRRYIALLFRTVHNKEAA